MKAGIVTILLAAILILASSLPALADDTDSITITMTGASEISIDLDKTQWKPVGEGEFVSSDTVYETDPPIEWCTLTIEGNCNVNTFIAGEDAEWVENAQYKWALSNDETNGEHEYVLWFRISGDTERGYVLIAKTQTDFWPWSGGGSSLAPGDTKQFGLKLLTPTYFVGGREMQTHITISAVAA